MKNTILHLDMSQYDLHGIKQKISQNFDKHIIYHIFNLDKCDYIVFYEELARSLGRIRTCHPVNDKQTNFSNSRDIRYTPGVNHYFASNSRQPLHNDYAYYAKEEAPDWLMIYCMEPSALGGKTNILSTHTLKKIMQKYNRDLLNKLNVEVNWKYNGKDGDKIHKKPILEKENINWNYWQIKKEFNNENVMSVRQDFFDFLENKVSAGNIYDFSKNWKTGDCIIFNDTCNLHSRDAFLGTRWLKDHAFFGE